VRQTDCVVYGDVNLRVQGSVKFFDALGVKKKSRPVLRFYYMSPEMLWLMSGIIAFLIIE
jgi:hypothetical protein